jgi:hypothetical protein
MKGQFDHEAFFAALDAHRLGAGLTWKQVADESGVSASTLARMGQGKRTDVDGLAALLKWSGLHAESFIAGNTKKQPEVLAQMTALLRGDPNLSEPSKKTFESVLVATYTGLRRSKP